MPNHCVGSRSQSNSNKTDDSATTSPEGAKAEAPVDASGHEEIIKAQLQTIQEITVWRAYYHYHYHHYYHQTLLFLPIMS